MIVRGYQVSQETRQLLTNNIDLSKPDNVAYQVSQETRQLLTRLGSHLTHPLSE